MSWLATDLQKKRKMEASFNLGFPWKIFPVENDFITEFYTPERKKNSCKFFFYIFFLHKLTLEAIDTKVPRIFSFLLSNLMFFLRLKLLNCLHIAPFLRVSCPEYSRFHFPWKQTKKKFFLWIFFFVERGGGYLF